MTEPQTRQARQAANNCAHIGLPYELAVWLVADWMRKHGIRITIGNLEEAFADFK